MNGPIRAMSVIGWVLGAFLCVMLLMGGVQVAIPLGIVVAFIAVFVDRLIEQRDGPRQ